MKTKNLLSTVMIVSVLVSLGCGGCAAAPLSMREQAVVYPEAMEAEEAASEGYAPAPKAEQDFDVANEATVERLVVRDASLSLVVEDTAEAVDAINAMAAEMGGYIVESSVYQYQEGQRASVRLRIPASSLDAALDRVRDLATEVRSEDVTGTDVTDEYVDKKSQLRSLEAAQQKLLEFLEEAEDTEAALAVYAELREIDAEIEQVKGRIQYLEQSTAMATLRLDIVPDKLAQPIQVAGWHPEGTLKDAVQALVRVLQFIADAAIVIVVLVVPVVLVLAVPVAGIVLLVRWIIRRRRAKKASSA